MIFSLVFIALIGFMYIITQRLSGVNEQQEDLLMKNLANNIISEIELASSVNNNYLRRFNIPPVINGKEYSLEIEDNILSIRLFEGKFQVNKHSAALPLPVKGTFIEKITVNTTDHCISKNNVDGIRIARNQAALDTSLTEASQDESINVIISLNCVDNIKSVQFTIKYDPDFFVELVSDNIKPVTQQNSPGSNALFDSVIPGLEFDFSGKYLNPPSTEYLYNDKDYARYTYAFIGSNCASGSGAVANVTFRVKDSPSTGTTTIEFDPNFDNSELLVLDCTTNQYTKEGIPDSKTSVRINIV